MTSIPRIIHTDDSILVIDKPAGQPSVSLREGEGGTLAAWILEEFPGQLRMDRGALEAGLIHRLDNDTSGIIIAARTTSVYLDLRRQFDAGEVRKEYEALVLGNPPDEGEITGPIAHHPRKKKKMLISISASDLRATKARPALTQFRLERRYCLTGAASKRSHYALLWVTIRTGVRHQIRAHLASIGHPVAGDKLYQSPKVRAADRLGLGRHFLHARRIAFVHPSSGSRVEFSSELSDELSAALGRLTTV